MPPLPARFVSTFNAHDLEGFAGCFAPDYRSEHPQHPARGFAGRDHVRENWKLLFEDVPDVRMDVLREVVVDGTWWMECRISGTRRDGSAFELAGVTVNGIVDDRIAWARLYLEELDRGRDDMRTTVERWARHLRV